MKIAARMDKLPPSGIRKVNEKALAMERAGETVYHFEIGRPDFDTPAYIKKAAMDSLARGEVFYTSNFGTMDLRQAIADKLREQNGVDYKTSEILVSVDGHVYRAYLSGDSDFSLYVKKADFSEED